MKNPLLPVLAAAALLGALPVHAQLLLVTEAEAQASRAAPETISPKAAPAPDAPRIQLLAPSLAGAVPTPTRIQLQFSSPVGAPIRPETFKVYYGAFRIDITARIAGAARVTAEGVDVAQAVLPSGSHKLLLEVQDGAGRTGERLLQFSVE